MCVCNLYFGLSAKVQKKVKIEKLKVKSVVCTQFNEELVVSNKIRENREIKENRVDEARVSQPYLPY